MRARASAAPVHRHRDAGASRGRPSRWYRSRRAPCETGCKARAGIRSGAMKPILITGARGNVGREVMHTYHAADVPIRLTGGDEAPLDNTKQTTKHPTHTKNNQNNKQRPPPISDM